MYIQPFYIDIFSQIIVMCVAKRQIKTTDGRGKMRVRLTKIAIDLHWRGGIVDKLLCYRESTNIQGLFV